MTDKEIKGVIDAYANDDCLYPDKSCEFCKNGYCISGDDAYKCLLKRLDKLGVVIKVDDIQPINNYADLLRDINTKGRYDIVAVEPLIKDGE